MAKFGDELRNALNETEQETHAKNRWSETFEQDNGSIDHDTIEYLMHGSGKKRQTQNHRGCLKVGHGFAMLYSKPYIDSAEDLVPEIESVLSELISYHVSAEDASRFLGEKYLGFRIKATW